MGRAKSKKKKKSLALIKELTQIKKTQIKKDAEIVILEDIPHDVTLKFGSIPDDVMDSIYLGISQGVFRAIARFDVYKVWLNQDGSRETTNQIMWAMWVTDDSVQAQSLNNWKNQQEQYLRDYATECWIDLQIDNLNPNLDSIRSPEYPEKIYLTLDK